MYFQDYSLTLHTMKKIQTKDVWLFVAQVLLLSLVLLSPGLISYVTSHDSRLVWESLTVSAYWLAPAVVAYLINFYLCVPMLWFRHSRWQFIVANVALITVSNAHILFKYMATLSESILAGYASFTVSALLVNLMAVFIAISIRYVIRQGVLFRDNLDTAGRWNSHLMDVLAIDEDGDFHIIRSAKAGDIADMKIEGKRIMNSFCFGPALVIDGAMVEDFDGADTWMNMGREYERQRIAFCQVEPLHYKVVCCSGPYTNTSTLMKSTGLTLADFTRLVAEQDVKTAYNLDGGDSSLLYFHGRRINEKPNQSIRKLQDVIYFVSAEGL